MLKKKLLSAFFVMSIFVFLTVTGLYANEMQGDYGNKGDMEHKFFGAAKLVLTHAEHLTLANDQLTKVQGLILDAKKEVIRKDAEIEILALDIKSEIAKDSIDVKAVNKLIDKKYDLKKEKTKALVSAYANLFNVLNPEQKALFKGLTGDRGKDCTMMKGSGHGAGMNMEMDMGMGKGKCPMKK